jgi:hypothetical protein
VLAKIIRRVCSTHYHLKTALVLPGWINPQQTGGMKHTSLKNEGCLIASPAYPAYNAIMNTVNSDAFQQMLLQLRNTFLEDMSKNWIASTSCWLLWKEPGATAIHSMNFIASSIA